MPEPVGVHLECSGGGGPSVLLVHGSGATAAVWAPLRAELDRRGIGLDLVVVDLPGHGRSGWMSDYHHGSYAAAIAAGVAGAASAQPGAGGAPVRVDLVVGHSLGALVALTLAGGGHGVTVGAVTAMAMKVDWTPEQLRRRAARAARPPRTFPDRDAAAQRFAMASGLSADTDPRLLATGVRRVAGGYRLAADPRTIEAPPAGPAELSEVMGRVAVPVRLVCGDADPGVDPSAMGAVLGRSVQVVPGAGHNLHLDRPTVVADLVEAAAGGAPPGN